MSGFANVPTVMITADHDLVRDDRWSYRDALIDAFSRRRILPRGVYNLSEPALLWNAPRLKHPPLEKLSFRDLRFEGGAAGAVGPRTRPRPAGTPRRAAGRPAWSRRPAAKPWCPR